MCPVRRLSRGPTRELLPIPTRRSSDPPGGALRPGPAGVCALRKTTIGPRTPGGAVRPGAAGVGSEEHTSELQSRGQLVCRPLVENEIVKVAYGDDLRDKSVSGTEAIL